LLELDIKLLWGRSANRCARCKTILSPVGTRATLGEMAHIVGKKEDGPRGQSELSPKERDEYDNLILLCPTHHTEIDSYEADWPVATLHEIKAVHEQWVTEQLSENQIKIAEFDNSSFIERRKSEWDELANGRLSLGVSLTPLDVGSEAVDILDKSLVGHINGISLYKDGGQDRVNSYQTRPSTNSLLNSDIDNAANKEGHSISVYRNGHIECFQHIGRAVDRTTRYCIKNANLPDTGVLVAPYTSIAEPTISALDWFISYWNSFVNFGNMTLTIHLACSENHALYLYEQMGDVAISYPVQDSSITFSTVVSSQDGQDQIAQLALARICNGFGVVLGGLKDDAGELIRPQRLSPY